MFGEQRKQFRDFLSQYLAVVKEAVKKSLAYARNLLRRKETVIELRKDLLLDSGAAVFLIAFQLASP